MSFLSTFCPRYKAAKFPSIGRTGNFDGLKTQVETSWQLALSEASNPNCSMWVLVQSFGCVMLHVKKVLWSIERAHEEIACCNFSGKDVASLHDLSTEAMFVFQSAFFNRWNPNTADLSLYLIRQPVREKSEGKRLGATYIEVAFNRHVTLWCGSTDSMKHTGDGDGNAQRVKCLAFTNGFGEEAEDVLEDVLGTL